MRITVVHEWLTNWAGSEQVAEALVGTTGADTLVVAILDEELAGSRFPGLEVRASWVSRMPGACTHWSRYAAAMLPAWSSMRIDADVLVVSSHWAAHAAARRFAGPSIVYYHTPARLLWCTEGEMGRLPGPTRALVRRFVLPVLRHCDRAVSRHPSVLLANSTAVARRIERVYGRTARVLHPPVSIDRWTDVPRHEGRHLLWLGRLVAYKRPDLAIEVSRRTGFPLVVVGDGPQRAMLERSAPPQVTFLGHADEAEVRDAMAHARLMLVPGEEDFGIAPVEALAAGVPVVARGAGGALDYVNPGRNGLLVVDTDDARAYVDAVRSAWESTWDVGAVRASALPFAPERFREGLQAVLDETLGVAWRDHEVAW